MNPRFLRSSRGFTYIEVIFAATMVVLGLLGYAASLISTHALRTRTAETGIALNAARYVIEEISAIPNLDYVIANLNGHTFAVAGLRGPDPAKRFSDGTLPEFRPSSMLPPLPVNPVAPGGTAPTGTPATPTYDPALGAGYSSQPVALAPATDATIGYARVTIDATNPNLVIITVDIEFGTAQGNRRLTLHSHAVRPVNLEDF